MKTFYHSFETDFCGIIIAGDEEAVNFLHLDTGEGKRGSFDIPCDWIENKDIFAGAVDEIMEYFNGKRKDFTFKIDPRGTDFQKKIWNELRNVPYGKLATYKDIAAAVGNPKASRAVGSANSKNPIPLIIPCHRIVGANGKLTGFAHGLEIKNKLIEFERDVKSIEENV